jgi:hypothetical protein
MPTDAEGGNWPDEYFLDGPVPGGDDLLDRALSRVRRKSTRSARLRGVLMLAALLLATGMLTSAGMAIGRWSAQPLPRVATDVSAGATLRVTMIPADGGSYLNVRVDGLPAGTYCWLAVTATDGSRLADGSWQVGPQSTQPPVDISIWLPPADVSAVDVTASTGAELTAPVH